jgi:hypothetical protein
MNITELDSYNLGDAVKFNDQLNPRLWGPDEKLLPSVREQLLRIADDFREFLGINVDVDDITISGSNAAYTYTPHSDIDLHLVVDLPQADASEVYRELFDAKKYAYNDQHDITIGGYDVELYVQDARKPHASQGIYSVKNNDWVSVPKRRKPDINDISVQSKFEDLGHRIEAAIATGDYEKITDMAAKVREYRQAGLDAHGEFGPENLAFKILRSQGLIKKLYDARNEIKNQQLSLDERRKKRKKKSVRYGYGGYWYPGTAYAGQDHPAGAEGGGGDGGGGESLRESAEMSDEDTLRDFVNYCAEQLGLKRMPTVKLRRDPQWSVVNRTFGRYQDDANTLEVAFGQRHIMDVLRTVAHELTHKRQHERNTVPDDAGETGSPYENEANARAGILMRDYGQQHPELFDAVGQAENLKEEIEKAYGILGYKVVVRGEYFYVYKGDQLIYRSVAPRTYTYDQLVNQVKRAISVTGSTVKNPGVVANPKSGLEDAYKKLIQIITYRVDRNLDVTPETIKKEVEKIVSDYQVPEKDLREKWAQTKISKYSNYQRSKYTKTPELFAAFEQITKYFQNQSHSQYDDIKLYKIRMAGQENQWIENKMQEFMQKHGLSVTESASGYIPTKAQAKDPQFSMALTQDIRPGQLGKEANKLKLKTNRQGVPQVANPNGLFERLSLELAKFKKGQADEDYSPDSPPGPEFKPTMPAGTVKVDVSDVYDWYKLGQHISNMKGLGKHDFGSGPPASIISFGDEDTEHKFIQDLKRTGLDVTDIDPRDSKQPPGMKKVKTDPTYNVDETLQAPVAKDRDAEQYYRFIVAKAKMGRPLTRGEQDYVKMYQMYRQQKLAEGAADHVRMVMSRAADIMKQRGFRAVGQLSDQDLEKIARETDATPHDVAIILNIDHAHEQAVAEDAGGYPDVLYHGSTQEIKGPLTPRQANDIGGHPGSNKNAIYATDDPNFAIAYSLAERGSDTGTFGWKKEPRLIFFGGKIRHGKDVYIHVLPTRDEQGQPLFIKGGADAEWYSLPGVTAITPIKVITEPVDRYLHSVEKADPRRTENISGKQSQSQARCGRRRRQ